MQENRMITLPDNVEEVIKCPGKGIIMSVTMAYCATTTKGGIYLPDNDVIENGGFEKKYDIGRVVAIGPDVTGVKKGEIVIYQKSTAFRLPDGGPNSQAKYFRIEESTAHIICVLPPCKEPKPEKPDTKNA